MTRPSIRRSLTAAALVPLFALSLAACGGDDGNDESSDSETTSEATESEEATEETEETETTEETEETGGTGDAELTPAGTELSLGESATVEGEYAGKPWIITLSVDSIDEGTKAELDSLKLDEDTSKLTPYYLKVSAELVEGEGGFDPANELDGFSGETPAGTLIEFGEFEPCNGETFELEAQPGDTLETCTTVLATKPDVVDSVQFSSSDTDYDRFDGQPVVWK